MTQLEALKAENEYLKEQIRLLKEIASMKESNSTKPWPTRVTGIDPDLFRGMCIS